MDCAEVASRLVEYHFASLANDERDAVEDHLVACTTCLRTYLALKRATESRSAGKPSSRMRERLRANVARTFEKPKSSSVFARRIPLYQGLAFAAVAAAIAFVVPTLSRRVESSIAADVGDGVPHVDTSRRHAESMHIY